MATHQMPHALWELAMDYAAIIYNLLPNTANPDNQSPHQMYFGHPGSATIERLRAFGCIAWHFVPKSKRDHLSKIDPTAAPFVFVGLPPWCRRSVLLLNPRTGKVVSRYARSVSFQEAVSGTPLRVGNLLEKIL